MRSLNIIHPRQGAWTKKNIINHIQHLGESSFTNKLQDISKTQYPSTRSFQGTRSEDQIVCKIGFVDCTNHYMPIKKNA